MRTNQHSTRTQPVEGGATLRYRVVRRDQVAARIVLADRSTEAVACFLAAALIYPAGAWLTWETLQNLVGGATLASRGLKRLGELGIASAHEVTEAP